MLKKSTWATVFTAVFMAGYAFAVSSPYTDDHKNVWEFVGSESARTLTRVTPAEMAVVVPNALGTVTALGPDAVQAGSVPFKFTVPYTVTAIDSHAFDSATNLNNIFVALDNPSFKSDSYYRLLSKDGTKLIRCPLSVPVTTATVPSGVKEIAEHAFYACSTLLDITISGSVTNIGTEAFAQTEITNFIFKGEPPAMVGEGAFPVGSHVGWDNSFDSDWTASVNAFGIWNGMYATTNLFDIVYELGGGKNDKENPAQYVFGKTCELKAPTRPGYSFVEWLPTNVISVGTMGPVAFTAAWEIVSYDIAYELNGGENAESNPTNYTVESDITLADPVLRGYAGTWLPTNAILPGTTGPLVFTANWESVSYDIAYELKGGENAPSNPTNYTIESSIELSAPTRGGYNFTGWTPTNVIDVGTTGPLVFTANWEVATYTISYMRCAMASNESNPTNYTIESEKIVLNNLKSSPGATFKEWSPTNEIPKGSYGDKTFTAVWDYEWYPIAYVLNGGTNNVANPTNYTVDAEFDLADPERLGYVFTGWTPTNAVAAGTMGPQVFTANWEIVTYALTYELGDGMELGIVTNPNPSGYTITNDTILLANPSHLGAAFKGWTPTNEIPNGSYGDKTLTAVWEYAEYPISYELNDGTNADANPTNYTVIEEIALKDPTRPGYAFTGWTPTNFVAAGTMGSQAFTANWEIVTYTITYDLGKGYELGISTNEEANPLSYTVTNDTIILGNPWHLEAEFAGWSPTNEIPKGSYGDKTFTAVWNYERYPVTYELGEGTNAEENPAEYTIVEEINLKDPTRLGYKFTGWTPTNAVSAGSIGPQAFTANWEIIVYNIGYDYAGGRAGATMCTKYTVTNAVDFADPVYEPGYAFAGWMPMNSIPVGTVGDFVFTAKWEIVTYTITYDLQGGSEQIANPTNYTVKSEKITLKEPVRVGYDFAGWANSVGDPVGYEIPSGSTGDRIFVANWVPVAYEIGYKLDGGENAESNPTNFTIETGFSLQAPTRGGYVFKGWTPMSGIEPGSTEYLRYLDGSKLTVTANWEVVSLLFEPEDMPEKDGVSESGRKFNGFLIRADGGGVAGTFSMTVGKTYETIEHNEGTKEARVTMTVTKSSDAKKVKIVGTLLNQKKEEKDPGICSGDLEGLSVCDEFATGRLVSGEFAGCIVQGVPDSSQADSVSLDVMNAFKTNGVVYAVAFTNGDSQVASCSITFAAKGKAKVAGQFHDGVKFSATAQLAVGGACSALPVVWAKKGQTLSFIVWFAYDSVANIYISKVEDISSGWSLFDCGESALRVPVSGSMVPYQFSPLSGESWKTEGDLLVGGGIIAETPDVMTNIVWNGTKFDAGKAPSVKYDKKNGSISVAWEKGSNLANLKLNCSKGKGAIKGSFALYAVVNGKLVKTTFTVAGVAINGEGLGTAYNKRASKQLAVIIELPPVEP